MKHTARIRKLLSAVPVGASATIEGASVTRTAEDSFRVATWMSATLTLGAASVAIRLFHACARRAGTAAAA